MDHRTIGYLLHAWVVVAAAVGSGLIVLTSTTTVRALGTVLIIVGLVSLMPAFRYLWWGPESTA